MSLLLGEVLASRKAFSVTVQHGEKEITISGVLNTSVLTPDNAARLDAGLSLKEGETEDSKDDIKIEASLEILTMAIIEWNIKDTEDGPMTPITVATLKRFPFHVLTALSKKVMEELRPNQETAKS
jgi:hypothetical protein